MNQHICTGPLPAAGLTRRGFLNSFGMGLGGIALASLITPGRLLASPPPAPERGILNGQLHFPAKAKRVIYLFMAGGPSQIETFDYKPVLNQRHGQELPDSVRQGQRLTGMSGNQSSLPLAGSKFKFSQHGRNGAWVSELLPHTAKVVDDLCIIRSLYSEAINHDPAITFLQTGSQISGRPSIGSWIHYGLGSDNQNLPSFVVLITPGKIDQPLYSRLWGSGFLPSQYQGVQFSSGAEPVLYLNNPGGVTPASRRLMLDRLNELHQHTAEKAGETGMDARIAQYEMAYRMQTSVPGVMDFSKEKPATFDLYGPDSKKPGTFAANCLLARRLAEKGVKFIQLYHQGWTNTATCPTASRFSAAKPIRRRRRSLRTSKSGACSMKRWWSGAASSGEPVIRRAKSASTTMGATITHAVSRLGWPAAASNPDWSTARRMTSATTWPPMAFMCTICMQPCCACSVWIMSV